MYTQSVNWGVYPFKMLQLMWFPGEYFLRKSKAFLSPSLIYQHEVFSVAAWNSESGLSLLILHTSGLIYSESVVKYFCIDWNVHFIV